MTIDVGAGHEKHPLSHYFALMCTFLTTSTAAVALLRRSGRPFPQRWPVRDLLLLGLATNRLSRLITRDKVTRAVRAPFTDVKPGADLQEVAEKPREDSDTRRAIGELLLCPRCVGMWASMFLSIGYMLSPGATRLIAGVLASATVSDFVNAKMSFGERGNVSSAAGPGHEPGR